LIIIHSSINVSDGWGRASSTPCPKLCWTYDETTWKENIKILHKAKIKFLAVQSIPAQIETHVTVTF